jgi:L-threonylcarbamoyladenylate synthase
VDDLTRAALALARGDLVCIPTESTYGLAADLRSAAGLARLAAAKRGRPADSPWPLIAPDLAAARALASAWPAAAEQLAARHWPGPLTLVVPARADLPRDVVGPGGGVAVRVSSDPFAAALARALGAPMTATSANLPGAPPAKTVAAARALFGDEIACYLDGGTCDGVASTLVAVAEGGALTLLRRGPIAIDELTADS